MGESDEDSLLKVSPVVTSLSERHPDIKRRMSVWQIDGANDFEFAWRVGDARKSDFEFLRMHLKLDTVSPHSELEHQFRGLIASSTWSIPDEVEFFSSRDFHPSENAGEEFFVGYSGDQIFVWHVMQYF